MYKGLARRAMISVSASAFAAVCVNAQTIPGNSVVTGNLDVGASGTPGKLKVVGQTGASAIPSLEVTGDGGVFFKGTYGVGQIPTTTTGSLLMWYPKKMALRAGYVSGSHWQDSSIGDSSVVLGFNSKASGELSFAFGANNEATGQNSMTFGASNEATNYGSIAIGDGNYASGENAIATGSSTAAQAKNQFVVGTKNIAQGSSSSWVSTDDLFVVGNGVSAYSNAFTVKKNGVTSLFGTEGATTAAIVLNPTGTPQITVGGQKVVTADSSGSFSIGARNPSVPTDRKAIEINAGGYGVPGAYNASSNGDKLILYRDAAANYDATIGVGSSADMWFKSSGTNGNGMFKWYTGSSVTNSMVLDGAGRLGIGTNSPTGKLEIVSGEYAGALRVLSGTSNTSTSIFVGRSSRDAEWAVSAGNNWYASGSVAGDSVFKTVGKKFIFDTNDGTGTPALTIAAQNGNVGIGTTSPSVHLKVGAGTGAEAIAINGGTGNGEGAGLGIEQGGVTIGSIGNTARLIGGGTSQAFRMQAQNSNNIEIVTYNANPIILATGNAERMRIDASGNLGVGTATPTAKLEVAGSLKTTGTVQFAKQGDIPMGEFGLNGD